MKTWPLGVLVASVSLFLVLGAVIFVQRIESEVPMALNYSGSYQILSSGRVVGEFELSDNPRDYGGITRQWGLFEGEFLATRTWIDSGGHIVFAAISASKDGDPGRNQKRMFLITELAEDGSEIFVTENVDGNDPKPYVFRQSNRLSD